MNKITDIVWDYHLHYCLWQEQQNNKVTQLCNTASSSVTLLYSFVWFLAYSTKKWPSIQYLVAIFHIKGMEEISVPGLCIPIGSYSLHLCNSEELKKKYLNSFCNQSTFPLSPVERSEGAIFSFSFQQQDLSMCQRSKPTLPSATINDM